MKTTQENINNLLNVVKQIFEDYSEYEPVLTGSLAMYLQGIDFGEINDIDIIFLKRVKGNDNRNKIKNDIKSYSEIPIQVFICPLSSVFEKVNYDFENTNIILTHHSDIYSYLKRIYDGVEDEKRNRQFSIYEEWLQRNNNSNIE